jgi:hypothetical protein
MAERGLQGRRNPAKLGCVVVLMVRKRVGMVVASALVATALLAVAARAQALPPAGQVSFSTANLSPGFAPDIEDYVVRCQNAGVTVRATRPEGGRWRSATILRTGDFSQQMPWAPGAPSGHRRREAHPPSLPMRCLPNLFPTYTFTRYGPVRRFRGDP